MAILTCASCSRDNDAAETFCLDCGGVLTGETGPPPGRPPSAERDEPPPSTSGEEGVTHCPYCEAEVPDPGNLACVECLRPFPVPEKPQPVPDPPPEVAGTRRDPVPGVRLRLTFSAGGERLGEIEMGADEQLLVGREPASRCGAMLAARDNVSRRHAVIGLDHDGAAWVRDEYSTNGTHLNDVPVQPGRQAVLQPGDRLAFGADVVAAVAREGGR